MPYRLSASQLSHSQPKPSHRLDLQRNRSDLSTTTLPYFVGPNRHAPRSNTSARKPYTTVAHVTSWAV